MDVERGKIGEKTNACRVLVGNLKEETAFDVSGCISLRKTTTFRIHS